MGEIAVHAAGLLAAIHPFADRLFSFPDRGHERISASGRAVQTPTDEAAAGVRRLGKFIKRG
jgi:hypothetical protein